LHLLEQVKLTATGLKRDLVALHFAARDSRTPWYAKTFVIYLLAYALSLIDLIPDFIPVLGYLDDLLLIPVGISIAITMIPEPVMVDCRERAARMEVSLPGNWIAAAAIVLLWIAAVSALAIYLWKSWGECGEERQ
jgi:uncharacterized membrane protein YkvA (DUF1232 family)